MKEEEIGESGHEFKLQLIKQPSYSQESSALRAFGFGEFDEYIASTLLDYDIVNFKSQTHYPNEQFEKHRILFTIKDKEKAIKFWLDYVITKSNFFEGCKAVVYL